MSESHARLPSGRSSLTASIGQGHGRCANLLARLLASPDASEQVRAMLAARLHLDGENLDLIRRFTAGLGAAGALQASSGTFQQHVNAHMLESHEELETYIVQEFFVSTNYLNYYKGIDPTLSMVEHDGLAAKRIVPPQLEVRR